MTTKQNDWPTCPACGKPNEYNIVSKTNRYVCLHCKAPLQFDKSGQLVIRDDATMQRMTFDDTLAKLEKRTGRKLTAFEIEIADEFWDTALFEASNRADEISKSAHDAPDICLLN